jgi:isopentenyl diphosphate isomerase/L-lactate dehydrogenase-like FMN-dependent dehydrogenase
MPLTDKTFNSYNIADLREIARKKLPKVLFEFGDRGTEDEVSLRNNRAAFERLRFRTHTLVDVSKRNQEITLFGKRHKMPVCIAPTGLAGLWWHEGELALARAAAAAGIPFTLATGSMTAMEKVVAEAGGTLWFQLYMWPDRNMSYELVERAKAAKFEALFLTADGAAPGNREYNIRNGFAVPFRFTRRNVLDVTMHPGWLLSVLARYLATTGMPRYENYPGNLRKTIMERPLSRQMLRNDSLNWDDLRELRKRWPNVLIVKGILHPEDAIKAADCGADGVVVSNHGGRNLDSSMAPLEALPRIVDAVGSRMTVFVDSGFRRGTDIAKGLALGANAVLLGRSTLYGIAAGGQDGAARALDIFREELDRVMALLGVRTIDELTTEYLYESTTPLLAPRRD